MNAFVKKTGQKWLGWAVRNPKKFFMYSMAFLSVSFIISIVQGVFFPSDMTFKIRPPVIYSKSSITQNTLGNNQKEMEKIVTELQSLKVKRDRQNLRKEDSLRIEYLFNQYQHLKNGH
ncbi:hypothetical protein PF438_14925 [Elizabethkingia meningoseptica]|uniref:hypothetical protein n=1 Tax=Elizabethkingia meningoseptica TaxID=238 RepID=UPI0021A7DF3E|nr:hypothetical protein [Elizabethkingia meningoseptica]EJK5328051.1 hypothetical protein [Elizabethkingia meningoseptica]MCT4136112.1 hypothetical protein [Elizabethkingia anophelis]WBS74186.1 hypothetical protein PF438_14925 [Elizabethkingia meningoseptica]